MANRKYFGTDGMRGRVGEAPITPELVLKLGWAAGRTLVAVDGRGSQDGRGDRPGVLIGKDTRISGYLLEAALESGLSAAGVDVYLCGPLPTPGIAYLTRALRLSAGIVVSASHNPFDDNGIKFFSARGSKLPDDVEAAIEAKMEQPLECVPSADLGKVWRVGDAGGRYIEFCKSTFPSELDLRDFRIVVDCAHGAGYDVAPRVFHELGAEVITVAAEPDGLNINHGVGATQPRFLMDQVRTHAADLGIALDGDGDRLLMVDGSGRCYDGDELLYVIARDYQRRNALAGGVVGTHMTNLGFEQALSAAGIPLARAKVGDRYVLESMLERGWQLGGENSGHIICLDKHTTGDATVAALAVLRALIETRHTLAEAAAPVSLFPQRLINVPVQRGWDWHANDTVRAAERAATHALGEAGRVLLRPSGTEPVLRVMVEARDRGLADRHAEALAHAIAQAAGQRL
ncbi:MAG TPA: phosphoglucosamine mutase [Casimicrobiaceae bacterium]|nr:phosphoglucosamine mutase [Casimicrobiaceae bacterium]